MKIGGCADVHLGNHKRLGGPQKTGMNRRCLEGIASFRAALRAARAARCDVFVVAGDLFDTDHPPPQLIAAVQQEARAVDPMQIILIVGNHDQDSIEPGDHALGPLADYCTIVEHPKVIDLDTGAGAAIELVCIPYNPAPAEEWLPAIFDDIAAADERGGRGPSAPRLLAVHLGIKDDETAPWLRNAHDAVDVLALSDHMVRANIRGAIAGNWHNHILWEDESLPWIVQCGALVPTGFDNPGLDGYGVVVTYDTETKSLELLQVPGPRFVKVTNPGELHAAISEARRQNFDLYVEGRAPAGEAVAALLGAIVEAKTRGLLVDGEVFPDRAEAEVAARTAASAARSKSTRDEAIAAFVDGMDLPDGVAPSRVIELTQGYLKNVRAA